MQNIEDLKVRYCKRHSEPLLMFPCKVFDGVTVGYYCVACYNFVPQNNPELDLIKKLVVAKK